MNNAHKTAKVLGLERGETPEFFTIEGLASTNERDSYDEIINQKGIDLSLVEEGSVHLNIEHGDDFPLYELSVVGTVTDANITPNGLWIKAKIYWDHPHAERIYAEIEKSPESVQLSVELGDCEYGDERFSDIVLTGTLLGVALTKNPANNSTYTELVKSLHDPHILEIARDIHNVNKTIRKIRRIIPKRKITVVTGRR